MPAIPVVDSDGSLLALVVKETSNFPTGHNFLTENHQELQFAIFNHPSGHIINRHYHPDFLRSTKSTSEVIIVKTGRVRANIFSKSLNIISSHILLAGDVLVLFAGGHGFEVLEESTIFEVKQGPYAGSQDKELF